MIRKKNMKRLGACVLFLLSVIWLLPTEKYTDTAKAVEDTTIASPVLGDTVIWDCVFFGSYPQGEITRTVDGDIYQQLESSMEWKKDNTLTINDTKYKRIEKKNATSTGASYKWSNDSEYHYFKFEPIKWRVINVNKNVAYLISDVALDTQKYNQEARGAEWNKSSLRSWLNGYGASKNQSSTDYSSNNFADTAFSSSEQSSLVSVDSDKVTILSEEDVKNITGYGFTSTDSRTCKASIYAQAMGARQDSFGACNWWLSANGNSNLTAKYISQSGEIYTKGYSVVYAGNAVRVAVKINLEQTGTYRYAGTVASDGTVVETVPTTTPDSTPTIIPTTTPENTPLVNTTTPIVTTATPELPTGEPTKTPGLVPTNIPGTPTKVPEKTAVVPTKTPAKTPSTATTSKPTTTTTIKKDSVWSHTASNGKYRVITIKKSADKDGTVGTVCYVAPIKKNKTSATIPATVTIKKKKFKVTTIANGAFAGNKKLKKVVIGKNIKKINANAFKECKKLSMITIHTTALTKSSIGKNAFKKISAKATFKVPGAKLKNYKKYMKAAGAAKTVVFKKK